MQQPKKKGKAIAEDLIIGQNLYRIRKIRNVSQSYIADSLGITFQQIQKYERGANRISASTLLKLSEILNVEVEDFFSGLLKKEKEHPIRDLDPDAIKLAIALSKIEDKNVYKQIKNIIGHLSCSE